MRIPIGRLGWSSWLAVTLLAACGGGDGEPPCVPSAEVCDGRDNDCNGLVDEGVTGTFYADLDSDGFGNVAAVVQACSRGASR